MEINESSSALKNFIKNYGATPYHALLSPVTPIKSNPIDADSDNDGVIDRFDSMPLNSFVRTFVEGCDTAEAENSVFTVLKVFDEPEKEIVKKGAAFYAYSVPNDAYKESATLFDTDEVTSVVAVVFSDSKYWLKLKYSDRYLYVYYEDIRGYADLSVVINLQDRDVIEVNEDYIYKQTGENYGYLRPLSSCACFSYATALSIILDLEITPKLIDADFKGYMNSYDFSLWKGYDQNKKDYILKKKMEENDDVLVAKATVNRAYSSSGLVYDNMCRNQAQVFFEIDQHLIQSTKPILFHIYYPNQKASYGNKEHWALILGKKEGKYQIYDPYNGNVGDLETTMIYYNIYGNDNNTCRYEYGIIEVTRYD